MCPIIASVDLFLEKKKKKVHESKGKATDQDLYK